MYDLSFYGTNPYDYFPECPALNECQPGQLPWDGPELIEENQNNKSLLMQNSTQVFLKNNPVLVLSIAFNILLFLVLVLKKN